MVFCLVVFLTWSNRFPSFFFFNSRPSWLLEVADWCDERKEEWAGIWRVSLKKSFLENTLWLESWESCRNQVERACKEITWRGGRKNKIKAISYGVTSSLKKTQQGWEPQRKHQAVSQQFPWELVAFLKLLINYTCCGRDIMWLWIKSKSKFEVKEIGRGKSKWFC